MAHGIILGQIPQEAIHAQSADTATTANSAKKLSNSRTFLTNLASTSSASFNGTANATPGVTGVLPVANGGTGTTSLDNLKSLLSITDIQIFTNNSSRIFVPKNFKFIILMPRNYYHSEGSVMNYSSYGTVVIVNTGGLNDVRVYFDNNEHSVYFSSRDSYYDIQVSD